MKAWGRKYPNCGFGGRFVSWVLGGDTDTLAAIAGAMAGRLYKKAYTTKPLDCRRGNNDGYKAARVGAVFYYGLDEFTKFLK